MDRKAVVAFVCCLAMVGVAQAQNQDIRTVLQTVPPADVSHPSGLVQGDLWVFDGRAGDVIDIRVDTRDDNNAFTSNLDPILFLKRPDGTLAAAADDEAACSRPPVCGFACPSLTGLTLDQTGTWAIVLRDFGGSGCLSGAYNLNIMGPSRVVGSLKLGLDDGAVQQIDIQPLQPKAGN